MPQVRGDVDKPGHESHMSPGEWGRVTDARLPVRGEHAGASMATHTDCGTILFLSAQIIPLNEDLYAYDMYVCMYVRMHVCMYVYIYIYICIYIYI